MAELTTVAAAPVAKLIDEFNKLPGVGPKSAQRLAYHILRTTPDDARALAQAIIDVKERIVYCTVCQNITDEDPCVICRNEARDRGLICVVEEPLDILALERTRSFKGLYHVLHGVVSPLNGITEDDIKVAELLGRVRAGSVREIILAMNPNLEGDVTVATIERRLHKDGANIRVTRLARGLSTGSDLEYADEMTLTRALEGRQPV
ncbi:MAG: recombination protein RecR [Chloroflexi bacterium]|nr:recombination protein RecR [Chloroflexota bacterium]